MLIFYSEIGYNWNCSTKAVFTLTYSYKVLFFMPSFEITDINNWSQQAHFCTDETPCNQIL